MLKSLSLRWTSEHTTTQNAFLDDGERDLLNDLLKDLLNSTLRRNHNKKMYSQRFLDSTKATTEYLDLLSMFNVLSLCGCHECGVLRANDECSDSHSYTDYIVQWRQQQRKRHLVLKSTKNQQAMRVRWKVFCKDFIWKPASELTPQTLLQYAS